MVHSLVRKRFARLAIALLALSLAVLPAALAASPAAPVARAASAPLLFVANAGQFPAGARFQAHAGKHTLWLTEDALWLTVLASTRETERDGAPSPAHLGVHLRLSFPGANPSPVLEPFDPLDTTVSYFRGNDPAKWRPGVPVYGGVRYRDLYPGIDLELHGAGGALRLRLLVRDLAALPRFRQRIEGADHIALTPGALRLTTTAGAVAFPLFELALPTGALLPPAPSLSAHTISAPFAPSPRAGTLPAAARGGRLGYSTFLGGTSSDTGYAVALDDAGSAVVAGMTYSPDFPTTPGAYDRALSGSPDVFVTKFDPSGVSLLYSTFVGGASSDAAYAIALDESGNAYLTGVTSSSDFPVTPGAYDTTHTGGADAFVTRLNAAGSALGFSTFLGGTDSDWGNALATHASGSVYIAGYTGSSDFPTTPGAYDRSFSGFDDAFVTKLNVSGSTLSYSTYLGGGGFYDYASGIAVNALGGAYVTGQTDSPDFPTTPGAYDTTFNGNSEAFVTRLNITGSGLVYSTFLGGTGYDYGSAVALGSAGNAFITGSTRSTGFPTTAGAYDVTHNGDADVFVTKVNSAGNDLLYSTFLGGAAGDIAVSVAVDGADHAYLTGWTGSPEFPTTPDAFDRTYNGGQDAFVTKLSTQGSALGYSTFFGGVLEDIGRAIAVDETGLTVAAGSTESPNFPTTSGAYDTQYNGDNDVFVTKLDLGDAAPPTATPTMPATATVTIPPGATPTATPRPSVTPTSAPLDHRLYLPVTRRQ